MCIRDRVDAVLNKQSGLLGVSGYSDDRDVTKAEIEGNPRAILAHEMLVYQIVKYIGGYAAAMNGMDCLVFTAGLGENQAHHRYAICRSLKYLGLKIDPELNDQMVGGKEGKISTYDSKVAVYVIPTNEEVVRSLIHISRLPITCFVQCWITICSREMSCRLTNAVF